MPSNNIGSYALCYWKLIIFSQVTFTNSSKRLSIHLLSYLNNAFIIYAQIFKLANIMIHTELQFHFGPSKTFYFDKLKLKSDQENAGKNTLNI